MKLLNLGKQNYKLAKSDNFSDKYLSCIQYMAPAKISGHQMCPQSSLGCRESCLNTSGHGRYNRVQQSRIEKTKFFFNDRKGYFAQLKKEIESFIRKSERMNRQPCIRLNGTSDLKWEELAKWLFTEYSQAQFYDYTKIYKRMLRWLDGELPENYHLTFSRHEKNDKESIDILNRGGNVAVVFFNELPKTWNDHSVYNGDQHDLRFIDPVGKVCGLIAKGRAKHDKRGFVLNG